MATPPLGGSELRTLYITSARTGLPEPLDEREGALFELSAVGPGVREQVLGEQFKVLLEE